MEKRKLGKSDLYASPIGLGCYAIGGPFQVETGQQWGWSGVDDRESIRAIHAGLDAGINFLDTAQAYGCGHSEAVIGRAIRGRREKVILATKFGKVIDETAKQVTGSSIEPNHLRGSCEDSLRRLGVETIDLFQWHESGGNVEDLPGLVETLEALVAEGKIRWYGWSTDDPERVRAAVDAPHFLAVQHRMHVFDDHSAEILDVCKRFDLASIIRGPLAMGVLTGKFNADTHFHLDDVRHSLGIDFSQGWGARMLARIEAVREVLCSGGRTPAQGALAWIWSRSDRSIPIPGFKTAAQVAQNAAAMAFGPLDKSEMDQIAAILGALEAKEAERS